MVPIISDWDGLGAVVINGDGSMLDGMAFFIPVIDIERIPRYLVFHGILAIN